MTETEAQQKIVVRVNNGEAGRGKLSGGAVGFLLALEGIMLITAWVFFGIDFWIPLQFWIIAAWMLLQARSVSAAMILSNGALGLAFAHYLTGFALWPSTLLGFIAVVSMALSINDTIAARQNKSGAVSGDANPIAYIVAIIAGRAYLATSYTSVSELSSFSSNFLNWLTIFVVGIVPGWPTIANVISAALLNGTLLVYLALLLKRIANPLAN